MHFYPVCVFVSAAGLCVWSVCVYMYVCIYVCMYAYICMYVIFGQQKWAVWGLTAEKSPVSVNYCLLIEFNSQERDLLRQAIRSGKEISNHFLLTGQKKGSGKLYYILSHTLSTYIAAKQC